MPDGTTKAQLFQKLLRNNYPGVQALNPTNDPKQVGLLKGLGGALDLVEKAGYGAGGKVTDIASSMGASPEVSGGLGALANVGVQSIPTMGGAGPISEAVGAVTKPMGRWLMGTAIKPTWEMWRKGKGDKAIDTMLNEPNWTMPGVNATEGGMNILRDRSAESQALVKELLSKHSGETVNKRAVANYGQDAIRKFENQPLALQAQDDIDKVMQTFYKHPKISSIDEIPIQTAQDLKQGYYKALGDKSYDELKTPTTEGEKAIARGLKELQEAKVPEIGPANARTAALINALKVGERRVQMSGNNNPLGLAALAHSPSGFAAFMADKLGLSKSFLARLLYSGAPGAATTAIPGAQLARELQRMEEQP